MPSYCRTIALTSSTILAMWNELFRLSDDVIISCVSFYFLVAVLPRWNRGTSAVTVVCVQAEFLHFLTRRSSEAH
jgi:hypothetical protein